MADGEPIPEVKNVLYLTYDGLTDPLGQSQILPYLEGLAKKGYTITIVSFEKPKRFAAGFNSIQQRCHQYNLIWQPLKYHKLPPILSTLIDIFNLKKTVERLQKKNKYYIVHCRSYITAVVGLWLKSKYGTRFIFDMRGFWADERVEGGLWNLANPVYNLVYKVFKKQEKEFLTKCDHIISLTENGRDEINSWGIQTPISVIPCCVDTTLFDPDRITLAEQKHLRESLNLQPNDFILLYLGSWGTWYMTNEMLDFFSMMKQHYKASKLLIISPDSVDLKNYQFANDVIKQTAVRSQVPLYISIASAAIIFIKPTFSKKASSATKMAEILSMNVPVITNSGWGDVAKMEKESIIINQKEVVKNWQLIKKTTTRKYCLDHLSLDMGVDCYSTIYEKVLRLS